VEDFALCMNGMVITPGEIMEEHKVVEKILRCVSPRVKQIALAISTLLDMQSLTIVNLVGRLKVVEDAFEEPPSTLQQDGKLYLIKEEWDALWVRREAKNLGAYGSRASSVVVAVVEALVITDTGEAREVAVVS
jgi:hypothetical protein